MGVSIAALANHQMSGPFTAIPMALPVGGSLEGHRLHHVTYTIVDARLLITATHVDHHTKGAQLDMFTTMTIQTVRPSCTQFRVQ